MPEERDERLNRELIELLNELRVALPGVQVLFAFLLVLPFQRRFGELGPGDRAVYFATFLCTALASALLIAPSAYHRLRFREHDKEHMILVSNRLAIAGLLCLAVAITCVVFVITDFLFHRTWAATFTAMVGAAFLVLWYGLPLAAAVRDLQKSRRAR